MTVRELIDQLNDIEDKDKEIVYIGWERVVDMNGALIPDSVIPLRGVLELQHKVEIHD